MAQGPAGHLARAGLDAFRKQLAKAQARQPQGCFCTGRCSKPGASPQGISAIDRLLAWGVASRLGCRARLGGDEWVRARFRGDGMTLHQGTGFQSAAAAAVAPCRRVVCQGGQPRQRPALGFRACSSPSGEQPGFSNLLSGHLAEVA